MSDPNSSASALARQSCKPCEAGGKPLDDARITALLAQIPGWERAGGEITKTFRFKNYHESIAFVNATAWISHREDHHPDLEVGYNKVRVRYSTHSVGGLSENDFICAAKIEALMKI
ncbi:MAG: pterin-4-alpha-carbinolamine dehydratase [Phycisphaerales bacterium]|jgi:4a-hydroxytetrahydrobiopterin dehydratase|nr:pterin-4-alpha-carbinolamine dehydratase [Phycisphaerales bacterium]MDB5301745.1 pterin-4-alpha-carbinolamine dehydratase [Phycisphaerales bacterium]MDB5305051.1 pterin-4-alpha-carbinolamine dehydratase [Phycisphaerales bacterium]